MTNKLLKGSLVLVNSTDALNKKVDGFGEAMVLFGTIVKEFHGKLMLTASDETDGYCFLRKFTPEGWLDVCVVENKASTGFVPFPAAALDKVDDELFCADDLNDVVLIKRKAWFTSTFGSDLSINPNRYEHLDQVIKFHRKVLRIDNANVEMRKKGLRVLKKFTLTGWETIYVIEGKPESGYLLFPEEIQEDFNIDMFFSGVTA